MTENEKNERLNKLFTNSYRKLQEINQYANDDLTMDEEIQIQLEFIHFISKFKVKDLTKNRWDINILNAPPFIYKDESNRHPYINMQF